MLLLATPAAAASNAPPAEEAVEEQPEGAGEGPLLLDMPDESWSGVTKLTLGGEKVSLDNLGPMVVNPDGTVRRITNWDIKLPHEKEAIMRVISKRNRERIKALEEQGVVLQPLDGTDTVETAVPAEEP